MGLDNFLSIYSKRIEFNNDMIEKIKQKDICLCDYDGDSFRGKVYRAIVDTICNESIYSILDPSTLGKMAIQIDDLLNRHTYKTSLDVNLVTTDEIDVRDYFKDYDDNYEDDSYKIMKKELESLRNLFQFCQENNVYLHPDY